MNSKYYFIFTGYFNRERCFILSDKVGTRPIFNMFVHSRWSLTYINDQRALDEPYLKQGNWFCKISLTAKYA